MASGLLFPFLVTVPYSSDVSPCPKQVVSVLYELDIVCLEDKLRRDVALQKEQCEEEKQRSKVACGSLAQQCATLEVLWTGPRVFQGQEAVPLFGLVREVRLCSIASH